MGDGTYALPPVIVNGQGNSRNWNIGSNYIPNIMAMSMGFNQSMAGINAAPYDPNSAVRADRGIMMIGGAGDPLGIWEVLGIIAASSDNSNMRLAMLPLLIATKNGDDALKILNAERGAFSVADWTGYPTSLPKPTGPFKLLEGAEYETARKAANNANKSLHRSNTEFKGMQIHEIHPVKFGGDPTNPLNKSVLTPQEHRLYNTFWYKLQKSIK